MHNLVVVYKVVCLFPHDAVIVGAQVFVALLRISQPDGRRAIVRQALDVLTPALVKRLPQGENRYPIWIRQGSQQ